MKTENKIDFIIDTLDSLFPMPRIPLKHKDPYTLLISVVLSSQTTDKQVNKVTKSLFEKASTPQEMVKLSREEIYEMIKSCGLAPTKSRNILKLSRALLDEFNGEVPDKLEALESLPGVGHKSASVVLSQAFGKPAFPVDTHIHRLANRWKLSDGSSVKQTEKDLKELFPRSLWTKLHLQMIYFGREYCPARGHDPKSCPICNVVNPNQE
ncbi:endonuclease III [candidate division KSB1 bacterium]|nr:endonuclease III [candidate division KSB1 bacterium]